MRQLDRDITFEYNLRVARRALSWHHVNIRADYLRVLLCFAQNTIVYKWTTFLLDWKRVIYSTSKSLLLAMRIWRVNCKHSAYYLGLYSGIIEIFCPSERHRSMFV